MLAPVAAAAAVGTEAAAAEGAVEPQTWQQLWRGEGEREGIVFVVGLLLAFHTRACVAALPQKKRPSAPVLQNNRNFRHRRRAGQRAGGKGMRSERAEGRRRRGSCLLEHTHDANCI